MIYDKIENAPAYFSLGPRFEKALKYLQNYKGEVSTEKISIDGDEVFASIQKDVDTCPLNPAQWECHQKFADIQFIYQGEERFGICEKNKLSELIKYDIARDISFLKGIGTENYLSLYSGDFVIVFPQDAHSPTRDPLSGPRKNWRVVVKVRL